MAQFSRRRFLKISTATLGATGLAASWQAMWPLAQAAQAASVASVTTIPTFCEMCFWRCGGIAHVRDGKLWKFEGNPRDPQSMGRLCLRGTGAVGAHYDFDRLRQSLMRVSEHNQEQ